MMADVEEVEVVVAHVLWRVSTHHWAVDPETTRDYNSGHV